MDKRSATKGLDSKSVRKAISNSILHSSVPFYSTRRDVWLYLGYPSRKPRSRVRTKEFLCQQKGILFSPLLSSSLHKHIMQCQKKKKRKREGNEKKMDQLKPPGKITFKGNLAEN